MKNCVNLFLRALNFDINLEKSNILDDKVYYSQGCNHSKKWIANILP